MQHRGSAADYPSMHALVLASLHRLRAHVLDRFACDDDVAWMFAAAILSPPARA